MTHYTAEEGKVYDKLVFPNGDKYAQYFPLEGGVGTSYYYQAKMVDFSENEDEPDKISLSYIKFLLDGGRIKSSSVNADLPKYEAFEDVQTKANNSLQKPEITPTKTKLVGVGAQGQENIEIGDNLTLANGKLAAAGGSVSPTLNLINFENGEIRTSITEEEYNNLKKGLYNSVNYYTEVEYDAYLPSKLVSAYDDSDESLACIFSSIKITGTPETDASSTNIVYQLNISQKDTSGNYPITIEKLIEIPFGSSSSGSGSSGSGGSVNFLQATLDEPDALGRFEGTYTGTIDPNKVNVAILPDPKNKYTLLTKITDEGVGSATIITDRQPVTLSFPITKFT